MSNNPIIVINSLLQWWKLFIDYQKCISNSISKHENPLQSFGYQIFLYQRHIIAFEHDLSIHLVDPWEDTSVGFAFDELVQLLLELPDVTFDILEDRSTTESIVLDLQIHRHHEVLAACDKVWKCLILGWIGRRPAWRIFGFDKWQWNCRLTD